MTREEFEKLVSEWLDEPQRGDLREQIDAAVRSSNEFAALRAQYARLDGLIRMEPISLQRINWQAQARHIGNAVDVSVSEDLAGDDGLARVLGSLPRIEERIDWSRLHARISETVSQADVRRRIIRFPNRARWALGGIAAAAATIATFVFWPARPAVQAPPGFVSVTLAMATALTPGQPDATGDAVAVASIVGQDEPIVESAVVATEVFLMIDPPARGAARREVVN